RAGLAREHVDRGAAGEEVLDHLRGDRLRIGADALGNDPVVAREDEDDWALDPRRAAAQRGETHGEVLEPAEAARRLRQRVEMATRGDRGALVRRHDRVKELAERRHWGF